MSKTQKISTRKSLLGVATISVATLAAAYNQAPSANSAAENGARSSEVGCIEGAMAGAKANPCAASSSCNPCAGACNPCAAASNPCAANPCGAGNPCATANPCNPCAGANPCNPCAGANPCNPCAAGSGEKKALGPEQREASYQCSKDVIRDGYSASGDPSASAYLGWSRFNTAPYESATHGGRMVNNYANEAAGAYGRYEDAGPMPVGAILAKDSIVFDSHGQPSAGPLFLMEKMEDGFMPESGNWKYTLIMPDGTVWGQTGGKNSSGMQFCIDCHMAAEGNDYLFFLPDEFRVQ